MITMYTALFIIPCTKYLGPLVLYSFLLMNWSAAKSISVLFILTVVLLVESIIKLSSSGNRPKIRAVSLFWVLFQGIRA